VGDRGYLVTFEEIDPLVTLDLSDPAAPLAVGELKVPGFSTFLVPMDENHLLAIGQYVPVDGPRFLTGVQLSIFDVSDFAAPALAHQVVLGDEGTAWSEALYDPKAFAYFAERGLVALPVTIDEGFFGAVPDSDLSFDDAINGAGILPFDHFEGLIVYEVSVENGFTEVGRISTRFDQGYYYGTNFTRGVFIDQDVLAVTNQGVRAAEVQSMGTQSAELFYGRVDVPGDVPIAVDPLFAEGFVADAVDAGVVVESVSLRDGS
jgi:hypothetical protein